MSSGTDRQRNVKELRSSEKQQVPKMKFSKGGIPKEAEAKVGFWYYILSNEHGKRGELASLVYRCETVVPFSCWVYFQHVFAEIRRPLDSQGVKP